ncbi:MAG TPA: ATP-dependent DNA ligase [Opitutaceae bacterium]|nr:ATP-dependent DNA ligase [Opitutaceae bacterium]
MWEVEFRNGVWLPQVGWWLDAHFPVDRSFVSHAHFDHLAAHREILCSRGTARLMRARLAGPRTEHVLPFGHTELLTADCAVTLQPAGHIFGSAQALLAHERHGSLLYTGDFKLRPGLSAELCATPHADVLVMETTYGRPRYVFPPTEQVLREIAGFCEAALEDGETPVLFGYSLGKSQELLSGLAAARLPVMLHHQTLRLTRIYEELGLVFPAYREFDAAAVAGHVVICPPQSAASPFLRKLGRRRTAVVTGWALDPGAVYRYQCDAAFPLSDHADFPDLLRFVERVNPRRVLTLHGFAAEFAAVLRERGIEAWAINQDNQLDLALPSGVAGVAPEPVLTPPGPVDALPLDAFGRLAAVADEVRAVPRKLEKVALLAKYLGGLAPDDAGLAAVFLSGRAFPQSDPRVLALGWAAVRRAVLDAAGLTEAEFRAAYQRFADAGDAAGAVLAGRTQPAPFSLAELAAFFTQVAAVRGPTQKLELLRRRIATLTATEAKYLVKIITGDLRIGLKEGLLEEAVAAASGQTPEAVREASLLCGDIAAVTHAARTGRLGEIQLRVFHPLQFMLASPEPTADAIVARLGTPVWLEEKYDGIRCQLHKCDDRVELFSRDLHRITGQFPDLAQAAQEIPGDFIADGELLAWRNGRALPFAELQKRLGRKGDDFFLGAEIPVSVSLYDLLWRDGRTLLKEPLTVRRRLLAGLLAPGGQRIALAPVQQAATAAEIEAAFLAARARGNEGLMAKDPGSFYTPGRRGLAWLKLKKAYATLDVVVVSVEAGHGKRRDVLSDYTFAIRDDESDRLLTVGKAYSGLTDAEIAELTQHFLEHTTEVRGRHRRVVPDVVLEIAFDSIQPSDRHQSGFALRFPRIVRIRTDKTPAEIDTLATCRRLATGGSAPI